VAKVVAGINLNICLVYLLGEILEYASENRWFYNIWNFCHISYSV